MHNRCSVFHRKQVAKHLPQDDLPHETAISPLGLSDPLPSPIPVDASPQSSDAPSTTGKTMRQKAFGLRFILPDIQKTSSPARYCGVETSGMARTRRDGKGPAYCGGQLSFLMYSIDFEDTIDWWITQFPTVDMLWRYYHIIKNKTFWIYL